MGDLEKRQDGEVPESWWFPRDGEPVLHGIPRWLIEHARKQRSTSEPYIRFRLVAVRGQEFEVEFPDRPDAGIVWVDLGSGLLADSSSACRKNQREGPTPVDWQELT